MSELFYAPLQSGEVYKAEESIPHIVVHVVEILRATSARATSQLGGDKSLYPGGPVERALDKLMSVNDVWDSLTPQTLLSQAEKLLTIKSNVYDGTPEK